RSCAALTFVPLEIPKGPRFLRREAVLSIFECLNLVLQTFTALNAFLVLQLNGRTPFAIFFECALVLPRLGSLLVNESVQAFDLLLQILAFAGHQRERNL